MAVIRLERPFERIDTPRLLLGVRDAVFGALDIRYMPGRLCLSLFLICTAVEAVLLGRLWVQLSGGSVTDGFFGHLYAWTNPIVAPFRGYEGTVPIRVTGIFEFATLAAMEFYLVVTLIVIVTLLVVPRVFTFCYRLVTGRFKLGEKHPRVVIALDAVKMIEAVNGAAMLPPGGRSPGKPDRRGAAVQFRTRPTRGRPRRKRFR